MHAILLRFRHPHCEYRSAFETSRVSICKKVLYKEPVVHVLPRGKLWCRRRYIQVVHQSLAMGEAE